MISDVEHLLMCLSASCISWEKCFSDSFCFFNWIVLIVYEVLFYQGDCQLKDYKSLEKF